MPTPKRKEISGLRQIEHLLYRSLAVPKAILEQKDIDVNRKSS
jgi:hypothetical protein